MLSELFSEFSKSRKKITIKIDQDEIIKETPNEGTKEFILGIGKKGGPHKDKKHKPEKHKKPFPDSEEYKKSPYWTVDYLDPELDEKSSMTIETNNPIKERAIIQFKHMFPLFKMLSILQTHSPEEQEMLGKDESDWEYSKALKSSNNQHNVSHSCGHLFKHTIYAHETWKFAHYKDKPCPNCLNAARSAASAEATKGIHFPELEGSTKQKQWADSIRKEAVAEAIKTQDVEKIEEKLQEHTLAKDWITKGKSLVKGAFSQFIEDYTRGKI